MSYSVQDAIEQQQKLDELRLEFAKRAAVSFDQTYYIYKKLTKFILFLL